MEKIPQEKTRVCIIGDSHTGAFKLGWDEICSEFPNVEITFYAVPRNGMKQLINEGSKLSLSRDVLSVKVEQLSGQSSIDLPDFDAVLCVGMGKLMNPFIGFQRGHLLSGQTALRSQQFVSEDFYIEAWQEEHRKSTLHHVLTVLDNADAKNVFVAFKPLVSADLADKDGRASKVYNSLREDTQTRDRLWRILERAIDGILPDCATFAPQPEGTILNGLLTKSEYSIGSTRLMAADEEHDVEDHKHMNQDFGAAYLRDFLPRISA